MPINIYDNNDEPPKKKRKLNSDTNIQITGYFGECLKYNNTIKDYKPIISAGFFGQSLIK